MTLPVIWQRSSEGLEIQKEIKETVATLPLTQWSRFEGTMPWYEWSCEAKEYRTTFDNQKLTVGRYAHVQDPDYQVCWGDSSHFLQGDAAKPIFELLDGRVSAAENTERPRVQSTLGSLPASIETQSWARVTGEHSNSERFSTSIGDIEITVWKNSHGVIYGKERVEYGVAAVLKSGPIQVVERQDGEIAQTLFERVQRL